MRIVRRLKGNEKWEVVDSADYVGEADLQALIAQSPSLIPFDEIREESSPLLVAIREFGLPGSGNTDLIAFTETGDIAVIECKLAANAEIKRKVIGQILEYGAYLWKMSYAEIDSRVQRLTGSSLAELVQASSATPGWDEEAFRQNVSQTLANGDFALIIAVDEINEELARTIRFLNGCGNPQFSFHALELNRFASADAEILVPHLHGPTSTDASAPKAGGRHAWSEEELFEVAGRQLDGPVVELMRNLYLWSKERADRVYHGTGSASGSFTFHYLPNGKTVSVFSVYTDGSLDINFGYLKDEIDGELVAIFADAVRSISFFRARIPEEPKGFPRFRLDALAGQDKEIAQFKKAVEELGKTVHSNEGA